MKNRILIAENKELAEAKIKELENKAEVINALLAYYNELPLIECLRDREVVFAFLRDPLNYFENAILQAFDGGSQALKKAKKNKAADVVAYLTGIPYAPVIEKIVKSRISNLDLFDYLPEKGIFLTDKAIALIHAAAKEYTVNET